MKTSLNFRRSGTSILMLLLVLCCFSPLAAQVEVDENSNVGIGRNPVNSTGYTPKLSILGRIDVKYPGQYLTNIAMGSATGNPSMNGDNNTMIGNQNGKSLTSGKGNVLLGKFVGRNLTTGSSNVCLGGLAGEGLTTGYQNLFIGTFTGNNFNSGTYNVTIGFGAGTLTGGGFTSSGTENVLIGRFTGTTIQGSGSDYNVAIGSYAMELLEEGNNNVAIGHYALANAGDSNDNVAIGPYAGRNASGIKNIFIGSHAGENETGNAKLYIDNSATTAPLIYGDFNTNQLQVNGSLHVLGTLTAGDKQFRIDHPLDPENKTLSFACIEAPEMINMFRGNATTNEEGFATIVLPDYFSAANINFSYHLTCIGVFAQAIVSKKIEGNEFVIQTDQPNVEVSWQVLARRNDQWAKDHPLIVEQSKNKKGM